MEIGAPFPNFCRGAKKITIFSSFSRNPIMHIVCIYQCVFFSDGMYSVLIILCNYLQMIDQITLFIKKNILKY